MAVLDSLDGLAPTAVTPSYDRAGLGIGIVHLGPGAFFRAHLAAYTDAAIAAGGGDWGIEAWSLRSAEAVDRLAEQDGLYTLLVRDGGGTTAQVIGCVRAARSAKGDGRALVDRLADPAIRIVTMTLTEKAYGLDPATGGLDENHADIAHDLQNPSAPRGLIGVLVAGLARRRAAGGAPFTPLSCDNLPNNGKILGRLVIEFAERVDPELATWIAENVPFPSTMVDRITPASTDETYADAARLTGRTDRATVETEPFIQWAIEDRFADGRPAWDKAGAILVAAVAPYERMKLRMLNGTHSLIAYLGFLQSYEYVRDVMADPAFAALARRHMGAAAVTLGPVPGIDLGAYADDLIARFANRAIGHRTYQIAMDGTQKLPQRLLEPTIETLRVGRDAPTYALAVAAWMRYATGRRGDGLVYALRDPREAEIETMLAGVERSGAAVAAALFGLPGLFPPALLARDAWQREVASLLDLLFTDGPPAAIAAVMSRRF